MSTAFKVHRLLGVPVRSEHDVVFCRQRARQFAESFGFDLQSQTRVATAVSEIARNAFQYGGGGKADFSFQSSPTPSGNVQSFVIEIRDEGPGIDHLTTILHGHYRSTTGQGAGILGARRLMDVLDITTSPAGTTVTLKKTLPPSTKQFSPEHLQAVVDRLSTQKPASALEEIQSQNHELLRLMDEVSSRQNEVDRANRELSDTNSGVLALYDELETLHRVALTLATKVELQSLINTLIEATTDLTTAEWGAFFLRDVEDDTWSLYATAGPSCSLLAGLASIHSADYMDDFNQQGLVKIVDSRELMPEERTHFVMALLVATQFQSCLAVPVIDGEEKTVGAFVLGSARAGGFTERSERIVSSIAIQAVVAIEKAKLFESVKAASEAKDRFLAMLSHELRTPLNPVMAIISSLHDDPALPSYLREDLAVVLRNVRMEIRLIDDLLDFHRLIKGKVELNMESVDVHAVVQSVLLICEADLKQKEHHVDLDLFPGRPLISGEAARIQQVLWNVLKNAIKFTPPMGRIIIRTRKGSGTLLELSVTDNGRGIAPDMLPHIFTAFEQGETTTSSEFGGLGLGLAIARTFVEKHGGSIAAHSDGLGKGATVTLTLPLSTETDDIKHPDSSSAASVSAAMSPRRILLVDDHVDTLRSLDRLLTRRGHHVETADSYASALVLFTSAVFDVVISDLGLPDRTGIDLITAIRKNSAIPAIAMSGYGMEADLFRSREAGFELHLIKPVSLDSILGAIQSLCGSQGR
ncbi:MAG: hypothetical protein JWO94_3643 [Verrucomicrobiaceae bacterium]|nr:hypothetical protein [Verrucomicrobiaceae bacterium]